MSRICSCNDPHQSFQRLIWRAQIHIGVSVLNEKGQYFAQNFRSFEIIMFTMLHSNNYHFPSVVSPSQCSLDDWCEYRISSKVSALVEVECASRIDMRHEADGQAGKHNLAGLHDWTDGDLTLWCVGFHFNPSCKERLKMSRCTGNTPSKLLFLLLKTKPNKTQHLLR